MTPLPGTCQTASSAKQSRSANPSFSANAFMILRTSAALAETLMGPLPHEL
jgi:hypothetical protein